MHSSLFMGFKLTSNSLDLPILFGVQLPCNIGLRGGVCRGGCCVITQRPKGIYHSWGDSFCPWGDLDVLGVLLNQQRREFTTSRLIHSDSGHGVCFSSLGASSFTSHLSDSVDELIDVIRGWGRTADFIGSRIITEMRLC